MATNVMGSGVEFGRAISVARLVASAGVASALIFILCWLGTFIPLSSPTHAYIGLFTTADVQSGAALVEGGLWSLLFGALTGGLFALVYNAFAGLGRRS